METNAEYKKAFEEGYAKGIQNSIVELLKDEKFNTWTISTINSFSNLQKESTITESKRYIKEYLVDTLMVAVILGGIMYCSYHSLIDNCTTGTLIGTVIGYALSRLKHIN